jgi:hypothetical protein
MSAQSTSYKTGTQRCAVSNISSALIKIIKLKTFTQLIVKSNNKLRTGSYAEIGFAELKFSNPPYQEAFIVEQNREKLNRNM